MSFPGYSIIKLLAKGNYGFVYEVIREADGLHFAYKTPIESL